MDITIYLVIAGAGIIIGLLLGLMINALRGDSSKHSAPSESSVRGIDNILLWHDPEGGNLIVDLDGTTFVRLDEMRPEQRSRLDTIYTQLKRFMGIQETAPRPSPVTPQVETPAQVALTPQVVKPAQAAFISQPSGTPIPIVERAETIVVKPATGDKKGAKKPPPEPVKPLNIVGEIDDILQDMITGTPLFERGLQLVETPSHSIAVWIDKHQFENIEAVTDPEVQQVIHAAVKKWENKPL
jgi:hypothetical protein